MEGSINITLFLQTGSSSHKVRIESSRPAIAARLFKGKSVTDTLQLLPLVFSICANAQACAGIRAIEHAMRITPPPEIEWLRSRLVALETLREHLWRILLDWPNYLERHTNDQPEKQLLAKAIAHINTLQDQLKAVTNPFSIINSTKVEEVLVNDSQFHSHWNNTTKEWRLFLEQSLFYCTLNDWFNIQDEHGLQQWIETNPSVMGSFLKNIIVRRWSASGQCSNANLKAINGDQYDAGQYDSTSLTRVRSPLLSALVSQYGNGLLPRIVARITELASLSMNLAKPGGSPTHTQPHQGMGMGIGQVSAARGTLIHQVQLDQDKIVDYQVWAPTDWHFQANGVVSQALSRLQGSTAEISKQARLLIEVIDPCVNYDFHLDQEQAYA